MPRLRASNKNARLPPIDDAWGRMLARKEQLGVNLKEIADAADVSYITLRKWWCKPPIDWPRSTLSPVLAVLGLKATIVIESAEDEQ